MYRETPITADRPATTPSANFVRAVSDFLDTDPSDLLNELGYYKRSEPLPATVSNNTPSNTDKVVVR
jgi:hypothetical protein